jgi:hypothetical protein
MNICDIIETEDFSAIMPRVVFDVYFEPDAPAVAAVDRPAWRIDRGGGN